ncbi:hypothetical protein, partial [Acidovorax sp. SD340]
MNRLTARDPCKKARIPWGMRANRLPWRQLPIAMGKRKTALERVAQADVQTLGVVTRTGLRT